MTLLISFRQLCFILVFVYLAAILSGCAQNLDSQHAAKAIAAVNTSNVQRLANLYSAFQTAHYGPGPQNEAEFKEYIADFMGPAHLKLMQIDPNNIDAVFVSERDHKPFRVKYGIQGASGVVNAVVFEEEGLNGRRQVGFNGATVREVGNEEYQKLWDAKPDLQSYIIPPVQADSSAATQSQK